MSRLSAVLCAAALFWTAGASAQSADGRARTPWVAFSGSFGFGGEVGFGAEVNGNSNSSASRANPTAGFVINGGAPILDYLKLGGQLGFHWIQSESMDLSGSDRYFAFDLQLVIRPYVAFMNGKLELFLDVINGVGIIDHPDTRFSTVSGLFVQQQFGNSTPIRPGTFIGWSGQVLLGLEYHFMEMVSAHIKLGYSGRYGVADDQNDAQVQASVQTHQFALVFGGSYTF